MEDLLRLEGINKLYFPGTDTEINALKKIDLKIDKGEFLAIMGASGSGKSTLMHIMGFLDRPSRGKYYFEGHDTTRLDDNELAEIRNKKIGFVFQAFNLLPRTSSLDNVILPMIYMHKYSANEMASRGKKILGQVGLENRLYHQPSQLSGGQQQRVAIARALINNPSIIFADEPTGNLDTKSAVEIMDILKNLNDAGHTIVFVTHEKNIANYASRVLELKDGEIISDKKT